MSLLWNAYSCNVLPDAAQFVTFLAAPCACVRAATVSLHPTSFISIPCSAPFHPFAAILFAASHGSILLSTNPPTSTAHTFPQSPATLTGFHCATQRHSFTQYDSVHPLPIILLALRACNGCGFVMVFVAHTQHPYNKKPRQTLA